ncbi:MAG TPA: NAD(P)H-dependent oxidoreductase [Streptosporangiaceae bacterium]|nr:NAD(P)H-dependent oxidoreductase [Streptosporangiaceae bacterium]
MAALQIVTVTGNPRPDSRTHLLARTLGGALAGVLPDAAVSDVDLAVLGPRVLDPADAAADAAVKEVLGGDVLVIASPTYKATYSGLLKSFLDRLGTGSLAGKAAVPVLLGGAPDHLLAVDVHFTPLLLELGASVPARGLFVLESDVADFGTFAAGWAAGHAPALAAGHPGR